MALNARELLLIVRAQNQASGALSRVRRDINAMGRARDMQLRLGELELTQMRRARAAQQSANKITDFETKNALDLQKRQQVLTRQRIGLANQEIDLLDKQADFTRRLAIEEARRGSLGRRRAVIHRGIGDLEMQQDAVRRARDVDLPRAAQRARGDIAREAPAIARQISSITRDQLGIEAKLAKLREQAPEFERQLRSERAKLGQLTRPVVAAERAGLRPERSAINAQQAQRRVISDLVNEHSDLQRELVRTRLRSEELGLAAQQARERIARMPTRLAQIDDDLARSQANLGRQLDAQGTRLSRLRGRLTDLDGGQLRTAASSANLQAQMAKNTRTLQGLPARLEENATAFKQLEARQAAHVRGLENARRSHAVNQKALEQSTLRLRAFRQEMAQVKWDNIALGARSVSHIGRVMQLTGLVATAALGFAARSAANFESELIRVATQTGAVNTGVETIMGNAAHLRSRFLDIGADSVSSLTDINDAAYDLFSTMDQLSTVGIQGLQVGADMMEHFSEAAMAGFTDISSVSDGVVALMSAFSELEPTADNVEMLLNRMFAAVRFGRITFDELTASLSIISPAAKAAGQSIDTMLGTMAFLTKPLGPAKAQVGFARLAELLGRKKMVEGMQRFGIAVADANGKMLQMPDIIENIVRQRPDILSSDLALSSFFKSLSGTEGTIMARRAFVFMARDLDGYRRVLGETTDAQNEFGRSADAANRSAGVQLTKGINAAKVAFIEIGAAAIPIFAQMLKPLVAFSKWFRNLDDDTKAMIGRFLTFAAVGTLLTGIFLSIVGGLAALIISFRTLGGFVGGLTGRGKVIATLADDTAALATTTGTAGRRVAYLASEAGFFTRTMLTSATVLGGYLIFLPLIAKHFGSIAEFVGGAERALALLAVPLTLVMGRFGTMGRIAVVVVLALSTLARNFDGLSDALGGTERMIYALNIAMGAMMVMQLRLAQVAVSRMTLALLGAIPGMSGLAGGAVLAGRSLMLARLGVIGLGVALGLLITKIPGWNAAVGKLGEALHWYYETVRQRKPVELVTGNEAQTAIKRIKQVFDFYHGQREPTENIRRRLERMFPELDAHTLDVWLSHAERTFNARIQRMSRQAQSFAQIPLAVRDRDTERSAEWIASGGMFTDRGLQNRFKQVEALRLAAEKAPSFARWKAYHEALADMNERSTQAQQQALEAMNNLTPKFSDAEILRQARAVEALRRTAEAAPSMAAWKRFYAAQEALSNKATDAQLQAAQAIAQQTFTPTMRNEAVLVAVRNIERLKRVAENAPTMANWLRYYQAQETLANKASANQIRAAEETVKEIERITTRASVSPALLAQFRQAVASGDVNLTGSLVKKAEDELRRADISDAIADLMSTNPADHRQAIQQLISIYEDGGKEAGIALGKAFGRTVKGQILYELGGLARDARVTMKELEDAMSQAADRAADNMLSRFNELRDQNQAIMGQLFSGPRLSGPMAQFREEWGMATTGGDVLRDLQLQVNGFKNYQQQIAQLRAKGTPDELIQQLIALGPDAKDKIMAINNMTKAQRDQYVKLWQQSRTMVENASKADFQRQLNAWQAQGRNIALAVMAGIRQEDARLRETFRQMFLSMFGAPVAGRAAGGRTVSVAQGNTTITVHAVKGETLEQTMARAAFRIKNRR